MDRFDPDNYEVLYSIKNLVVCICSARDPLLEEEVLQYGVYNTDTGVREAETRRLDNIIILCNYMAGVYDKAKEDDKPTTLPASMVN